MKIINCEQGSPQWFELRKERMTASHAQAIAANGKGLDTYIMKLMQESYSSAEPDRYKSKSMERGNELEDSARFAYEIETGLEIEQVGFVVQSDYIGCSPDGLWSDEGCIEIKCLEDKAYFQYLLTNKIDTGYEWQMQMVMHVCKRNWCDYVVYNPNFKKSLIVQRVFIDNVKIEKLESGFLSGINKMEKIKKQVEQLTKEEN